MDPEFVTLVKAQEDEPFKKYLDACGLDGETLKKWFYKAAMLPGNWSRFTDRNAWLQQYFELYVPEDIRKNVELTNKRKFQRVPLDGERLYQ